MESPSGPAIGAALCEICAPHRISRKSSCSFLSRSALPGSIVLGPPCDTTHARGNAEVALRTLCNPAGSESSALSRMRTPELRGCIGIDFEACRLYVSKGAELHEEANRQSGAQVKCLCTKAHIMSYKREELAAIGTWWDEHCWDAEVDGCKPSC